MSDLNLLNNSSFGKRMKSKAYNERTTDKMTPSKHFLLYQHKKKQPPECKPYVEVKISQFSNIIARNLSQSPDKLKPLCIVIDIRPYCLSG